MIAHELRAAEASARLRHRQQMFGAFDVPLFDVLGELVGLLGRPLVAAIVAQQPLAVDRWLQGAPVSGAQELTMRTALQAARTVNCCLPASTVRRWFISPCDETAGRSPLEALAAMAGDGSEETRKRVVRAADRYWRIVA